MQNRQATANLPSLYFATNSACFVVLVTEEDTSTTGMKQKTPAVLASVYSLYTCLNSLISSPSLVCPSQCV